MARAVAEWGGACAPSVMWMTRPTWVLEGDIKGCFDNISHEWMLRNIPTDTEVLRKWLRAGYVDMSAAIAPSVRTYSC